MSYLRRLEVRASDSPSVDAFNRWRVSDPTTLFDAQFQYDVQPLIFEVSTANSGTVTHDANKASVALTTAAVGSSTAIIQSKQYHRYIPGKSQLVYMTAVVGAAVAGVVKRIGYFDASDGVYLEQNGTTDVGFTLRTSTSGSVSNSNRVAQSGWNLDKLDGTGGGANPSGITLDLSKSQVLVFDLQWLGHGRVRVGFVVDGQVFYAHEFLNANSLAVPYMKTANLPVRWESVGNGVATMYATCVSVQSEGGAERYLAYHFGYHRASVTAGSGSQTYAFSIRPKATFNSITNRSMIRPRLFDCVVTGVNSVLVEIYYGTAVATPTWTDLEATYSGLQVDTAGTPSGGFKVADFPVAAGAAVSGVDSREFFARYPLVLDIAGTGYNHFTVYVTGLGGASACMPGVQWEEVR